MEALTRTANGTFVLHPWCMPRSINVHSEPQDQGRFVVAYSRDGWFLLDTERDVILRWCSTEADARAAQTAYPALGYWFNGLILDDGPRRCEFCGDEAIMYCDDTRGGLSMFNEPRADRLETCDRHGRLFDPVSWNDLPPLPISQDAAKSRRREPTPKGSLPGFDGVGLEE